MSEKVEATDKEPERHIKKDMQEMKQRYQTVNEKLWNLETRMDTMNRDKAEKSCAIQSKVDALLRNSTAQEKLITDRPQGTRVDFRERQRNKRESTPLPRIAASTGAAGSKTIMKVGSSNTTNAPEISGTNTNVAPDAMTWASTWKMMNRTLAAFETRNTDSSDRGGGKSSKTFKKPKEFKDDSDGCIDTWMEVMRLHLEQDNLNDEKQACTTILSNCTNPGGDETKIEGDDVDETKKYSYSDGRNIQGEGQQQRSSWYKPRDDTDKQRSCANCGSADHHLTDCTTYK